MGVSFEWLSHRNTRCEEGGISWKVIAKYRLRTSNSASSFYMEAGFPGLPLYKGMRP